MATNVFMEAWLRMLSEATRGSADAMDTMKLMTSTPTSPDDMIRLMSRFMPSGTMLGPPDALTSWMEEYWGMLGVVPRYRYLEQLERNEQLRRRLEEAERRLAQMRNLSGAREQTSEEAQKIMTMWSSMLAETARIQSEWLRTVTGTATAAAEQRQHADQATPDSASDGAASDTPTSPPPPAEA